MHPDDLQTVLRALAFAAHKHKDQRRKDRASSPYINHPIKVVDILANEARLLDTEILCSALLHDTIEDTATTREEISRAFGADIATIVCELSDDKGLDRPARKQAQVEHAPALSSKARAVKLADKIANLRDVNNAPPAHWSLQRKQEYFDWAKRVVDGLRGHHPVLEEIFDLQFRERPEG